VHGEGRGKEVESESIAARRRRDEVCGGFGSGAESERAEPERYAKSEFYAARWMSMSGIHSHYNSYAVE
jgi:hypothetical protein